MIEGITLAFAVGLFAVVCPCAIAFAVALVGLPCRAGSKASGWKQEHPGGRGAMGVCFALVFALAALAESAGLERAFDVIPWLATGAGPHARRAGRSPRFAGGALPQCAAPAAAFGTAFRDRGASLDAHGLQLARRPERRRRGLRPPRSA